MRIAFDARPLAGWRTGIGRYVEGILIGLLPRLEREEFALCSPRGLDLSETLQRDPRVRTLVQKGWNGNLWLQVALPRLLQRLKVDLFHGTLFLLPLLSSCCPQVLNVYDLTLYRYPGSMEWKNLCLLRLLLPASLRKAKRIVTLSEFVRQEIGAMWPALAEKVVVIPGAPYLDRRYREKLSGADRERVLRRYGLLHPYILFVGTLEPRKNIGKMLEAYSLLEKMGVTGRQMVLVGPSGWGLGPIRRALKNSPGAASVRWLGYVPDEDLAVLYQEAELFLYLSLYEGFGFPPLEAMAAGTCVVASNRASLAECLGDAAVLVDPLNVEEVAEAIRSLLTHDDFRREVAEKGRIHAGRFSWEKSAEKTAQVYNALAPR